MHASCCSVGDYLFFPPTDERQHERARRERIAKKICAECPVLSPCRQYAIAVNEPYGIWGGMSESERRAYR
ncbi:WhiB family transcriptional regulator [Rhodococcus pyridinivorans]|uniref:WhiB family transcriptional regulator n=1 Tax=Rhodococcus pyridinivorans TaxID=103816 RepID=UPI0022B04964|nr:WhiB family transcriptional regulator [Rhodococcus pyridinivorans]